MTTALTAMPMKMTMSAARFLGGDMAGSYPTPGSSSIVLGQIQPIFRERPHA